nr:hypothetical protein [Tanacetum cinerariifolium]
MTGDRSELVNFVQKFLGTVKFGNDHVAKIMGYEDYQIGNVTISRVYYVDGLGHNLFSIGQFCDSDLEVAINDLKAQSQEKDTVIMKLKERIKSLSGNVKEEKIKRELEEIETINIELDHREKVLVITTLKDTLSILKGKDVVNEAVSLHSINPELLKIDVALLAPRLRNNRTAHNDYLKHTQEKAATLREIVENERLLNPLNTSLDYACKYTKRIQELLIILKQTCPCINDLGTKLMVMTPVNNNKKIRFTEHIPSSGNTPIKTTSSTNVVQIVLWYLDSRCSKHMTGDRTQLINFVQKFLGTVKFRNDHVAMIMGYSDYKIGNVTILRVYFVEGLGHNLFFMGQFCDSDLEVAFRQHTCFIRNLDASKTKSWLWHRRLSHLNFGAINHLARQGLIRGLPKLKFKKDHLCSACAMGKKSVNGKKYILVTVDDYSRLTWVKCLRSKDEAPDFIFKFLKMIQVRLKVS